MKLTGNLKKQVEKAETKDEKKSLIENAGMLLNDDELELVSGGRSGKLELCWFPSGTIEVLNEQYQKVSKYQKRCPSCYVGRNRLENRYFYFVDTCELFEGQECLDCGKRWVYKLLY